jgi:hypothetical protein
MEANIEFAYNGFSVKMGNDKIITVLLILTIFAIIAIKSK